MSINPHSQVWQTPAWQDQRVRTSQACVNSTRTVALRGGTRPCRVAFQRRPPAAWGLPRTRLYDALGEAGSETDVRGSMKDLYDPVAPALHAPKPPSMAFPPMISPSESAATLLSGPRARAVS